MFKLIAANFRRLKFNLLFILFSAAIFISMFLFAGPFRESIFGSFIPLNSLMLLLAIIPAALSAIFVGFFIGREYSDKTIRNKLIIGHTRTEVYLSLLVTVLAVTVLWVLLWFIGGILGGAVTGAEFEFDESLLMCLVTLFYSCAFTAGLVCISMLVHSRALAIVIHTQAPQYLLVAVLTYASVLESGTIKEPMASVVKAALNILPMGQWFFYSTDSVFLASEPVLILLSAAVIAVVTIIGVNIYKYKELK